MGNLLARLGAVFVVVVLYCASPPEARAQCNGQFAAGTLCGNPTGSVAPPRSTSNPLLNPTSGGGTWPTAKAGLTINGSNTTQDVGLLINQPLNASSAIDLYLNNGSSNSVQGQAMRIWQAVGTYAAFTASISGTTLTVTAIPTGVLGVGDHITSGIGVAARTVITALGTGIGGVGTYTVNSSQTVASEAMTALKYAVATYFDNAGALYTRTGIIVSGTFSQPQLAGVTSTITPPTLDPTMVSTYSDVVGPNIQHRPIAGDATPGSYLISGLNGAGKYVWSLENDGQLQWGSSTAASHAAMDTALGRGNAAALLQLGGRDKPTASAQTLTAAGIVAPTTLVAALVEGTLVTFTGAVPGTVLVGQTVTDTENIAAVPLGTTVAAISGSTVTMSAAVQVFPGDHLVFGGGVATLTAVGVTGPTLLFAYIPVNVYATQAVTDSTTGGNVPGGTTVTSVNYGAASVLLNNNVNSANILGDNIVFSTANVAAADFILAGGRGTGTGNGGKVRVRAAAAGGAGSTQNAWADFFTIDPQGTPAKTQVTGTFSTSGKAFFGAADLGGDFNFFGTSNGMINAQFQSAVSGSTIIAVVGGLSIAGDLTGISLSASTTGDLNHYLQQNGTGSGINDMFLNGATSANKGAISRYSKAAGQVWIEGLHPNDSSAFKICSGSDFSGACYFRLSTAGAISLPQSLMVGSLTNLTLAAGEVGLSKITASGTAPGAAGLKLGAVCGTNAGSAKIIAYAGTSTTPVTVIDNVGSGVTGC